MSISFKREWRLSFKLFLGIVMVWALPISLMLALSLRHLHTIQNFAIEGSRSSLISSQKELLKERLTQESSRLSTVFSRIQDETYFLGTMSQRMLSQPSSNALRNGSRYHPAKQGTTRYLTNDNDGNSILYAPGYHQDQDPFIYATEGLDLLLKPLAKRESHMVLGWISHRTNFVRAYPWTDFTKMPMDKALTSWPFYYLADHRHNPEKGVIFTPVYHDPLSKEWMISSLYPVYLRGRHEATVGIDLTIHNLLNEIKGVRFSKGSSSLLISTTEIIVASDNLPVSTLGLTPGIPPHGQNLAASTDPAIRKLSETLHSEKQGITLVEAHGLRMFVGYATVEPMGWKIVLFVPEAEFLNPALESSRKITQAMNEIRLNFIHILLIALLGIVVLSVIVILHQSKSLRTLLKGIRELGQGNLSHRIPEDRTEFGRLASALNSMSRNLLEKKEQLQRVFAEVEQGRKLTAVGRLAAGVAHEVNNPLATISIYTQMVLMRNDIPDEVSEKMKIVMEEIKRIQAHMRNLLDLSRLHAPNMTEIRPDLIVKEIADLISFETAARGIDFTIHVCDEPQTIIADGAGIKQVVWNLLRNALDAQEKGGTISVKTYFDHSGDVASTFVIEVADGGPGIPEATLPLVFEPFFTTKEIGKGTGLGLSTVYSIVINHGGTIEVTNLSPHGSLFRVVFPIKR